MPINEGRNDARAGDLAEPGLNVDGIVSVNDRGRRQGGRLGPFLALGAIACVVLIGLLLTINVIKSKMSGAKPEASRRNAMPAELQKTFEMEPPPLPGSTGSEDKVTTFSPRCPDGSDGNSLRGQDGSVVRNANGHEVKVCPNGQVLGVTPSQDEGARPIPVRPTSQTPRRSGVTSGYRHVFETAAEDAVMINDGQFGSSPLASGPNRPQTAVVGFQRGLEPLQPKTEGLLAGPPQNAMEALLTPSKTPMVEAARLTNLNLLLPKGRTIDCGMSVRVISTLAGQASCIVTQNVYSANGRVILIERGSEAVGEYRSGVSIGQKRLFVLWDRIITPGGVVINLDSPGADALGSTGLTGEVDNHWYERIGSTFLLSLIEDGITYDIAQQTGHTGGTTFVLGNTAQASNSLAQKILDSTINIEPTIYKNQGDRAVIYVARDLDFSNVYKLSAR